MPFDGMPVIDDAKPLADGGHSRLALIVNPTKPKPNKVASILALHPHRGPESISSTVAVLVRARALIGDQRRWCLWSFARGWCKLPVPVYSPLARRFCAIGAIMRAGRELLLPTENACTALQRQTGRSVEPWNDDPRRTHVEVLAAFDAAIASLHQPPSEPPRWRHGWR